MINTIIPSNTVSIQNSGTPPTTSHLATTLLDDLPQQISAIEQQLNGVDEQRKSAYETKYKIEDEIKELSFPEETKGDIVSLGKMTFAFYEEFLQQYYPLLAKTRSFGTLLKEWVNPSQFRKDLAKELASISDRDLKLHLLHMIIWYSRTQIFIPHSNPEYSYGRFDEESVKELRSAIDLNVSMGKQTTSSGYYYGGPYIHSIDYNHPNIPEEYKDIFSSSDSYAFLFTDTNNVSVSQAQKNFIGSHPEIQELIEKIMPKYIEKKHKKDLLLEEKALNEKRIDNLIKTKESLKTDKENLKNQLDMLKYLPENLKAFAHELATFNRKAIPDIISRYEKNPQADFLVFDNEKGKEFLLFCIENHLTPCLDGEHFIAIGLTERKVDSWAGMEYWKMITLWYNGEEQESKYYKYRDGFNSSKDNKVNNFSTVHDILVDDTVWIIEALASPLGSGWDTKIIFDTKIQDLSASDIAIIPEWSKEYFETTIVSLLKGHTRNIVGNSAFHNKYTWNTSFQNTETTYESAKEIDRAFDKKTWTGVIILRAQNNADPLCGKVSEYLAYLITPEKDPKILRNRQLSSNNIYNEQKSMKIPVAKELLQKSLKE